VNVSDIDAGPVFAALWERAIPWTTYLQDEVETNRELWHAVYARAAAPEWWAEALGSVPRPWRVIALSEDWCGDAVNALPVVARLAQADPRAELRILKRDENLDLMDRFLTQGSRSIPVALLIGPDGELIGWWGPRPDTLQQFVLKEKSAGVRTPEEIYRDVRAWYARDRGETIAREVMEILAGSNHASTPSL
jgi:hypothetical protein